LSFGIVKWQGQKQQNPMKSRVFEQAVKSYPQARKAETVETFDQPRNVLYFKKET
jgi:hypothetical protein